MGSAGFARVRSRFYGEVGPGRQHLAGAVEIPLVHGYVVAEGIVDSGQGRFAGKGAEVVEFNGFKSFTKGSFTAYGLLFTVQG